MKQKFDKDINKKNRVRYKLKVANKQNKHRLSVFRSVKNIYAQIIDDSKGETIVACSTLQENIKKQIKQKNVKNPGNVKSAEIVGENIAIMALEKGVKNIVFDRGKYIYHGRIKALAENARKAGLVF